MTLLHRTAEADLPSATPRPTSLSLVEALGAELAGPLHQMGQALAALRLGEPVQPEIAGRLEQALEQARGISIAAQQIARLERLPDSPGTLRLTLDAAVQAALEEARPRLLARGIEIRQRLQPVEVWTEPSRLALLLDAALEWAASQGHRLMLTLARRPWPDHALLVLRCGVPEALADAESAAGLGNGTCAADNLAWLRLILLAQALEVRPQRSLSARGAVLTLEFLDTVALPAHMNTLELEGRKDRDRPAPARAVSPALVKQVPGPSAALAPYLLLVSDDPDLRALVEHACLPLHLPVEVADTPLRAHWACARSRPSVLVTDDAVRDDALDALLSDLHAHQPRPQVIEISRGPEVLGLSEWSLDEARRMPREAAALSLPPALREIWPGPE